jgi:RNA polymerase sigma-70 factor (ECF subfamily)
MADGVESALARSARDPSAFGEFYAAHAKPMLVFFTRRVLDPETALDLTAETFAQAFAGREGFRGGNDDQAAAWLYTIAHRQLAHYWRKGGADRRMRARLGLELPEPQPDELERIVKLAGADDIRRILAESLAQLPDDQRDALRLRILEERGYPEVAALLGVSEDVVRARVSRALRALRHVLAPLAEQGELG